ncbi:uncharacterized protein LOC126888880 isoform X2 [Diabrotica virgifera virgifera]|uniref:CHK kinase-like domain-containing protein n=1 Tax=Diabrotica virgifera virgifera TaxID=50390 RepID=A0ABM5KSV0_DIAVI|nr:uncharacterized protein LOC126888880 isoform X2 [Diabrotica virgifera virgifera]
MVLEKSYIDNILKKILNTTHLEHYDFITEEYKPKETKYEGEKYFVTVKNSVNSDKLSIFIKRALVDSEIRKLLPIRGFFINENNFYDQVWPNLEKFQESYGRKILFRKIPRCYLTTSKENAETIVLEKLSRFRANDLTELFTIEQLLLIFQEYGRFHALSFAYKEKRPEEYQKLVSQIRDNYEYYKDIKMYVEAMNYSHKATGKPLDLRFVDFQLARIGTPVYDLASCLYACSSPEHLSDFNRLLEVYYSSLSQSLTAMDCDPEKIYSFEDLTGDWKKYSKFGFSYAVFAISNYYLVEDESDIDDSLKIWNNNVNKKIIEEQTKQTIDVVNAKSRLTLLLRHMVTNGFL